MLGSQSTPHPPSTMGRVWLEASTLVHTERAVSLSKIHCDLEKINPLRLRLRLGCGINKQSRADVNNSIVLLSLLSHVRAYGYDTVRLYAYACQNSCHLCRVPHKSQRIYLFIVCCYAAVSRMGHALLSTDTGIAICKGMARLPERRTQKALRRVTL